MAERPVECSHCKKEITVSYKEVIGQAIFCTEMCSDCPILEQKLHGKPCPPSSDPWKEDASKLCCANCMTTLESVRTGNPLGCSNCYSVFCDVLLEELSSEKKLPLRVQKEIQAKRIASLHIGKTPHKPTTTIAPSSRLTALNEALNEALKRENYEQAAWLRDQIKELMDKSNDRKIEPT